MEDTLRDKNKNMIIIRAFVLILVLMEDTLREKSINSKIQKQIS